VIKNTKKIGEIDGKMSSTMTEVQTLINSSQQYKSDIKSLKSHTEIFKTQIT
jgi:hypothetical protein